jgi:streptogramin lyase
MQLADSIGSISLAGRINLVPVGHDIHYVPPSAPAGVPQLRPLIAATPNWPPRPLELAYDKHGTIWFNDAWRPTISSIDASGHISTLTVAERIPRGRFSPVHVAIGPDGEAWYARTRPAAELRRADGSRAFVIPPAYGNPELLAPGNDALWLVTRTHLVRMSVSGAFTATPLPQEIQTRLGTFTTMTSGAGDTMWVAKNADVFLMNATGVIRRYRLPDATLSVNAMVTGCDGSLFVATNVQDVLRLPSGGSEFRRYVVDYRAIDRLTRTPDCKIWFAAGNNMPKGRQFVGTLKGMLVP